MPSNHPLKIPLSDYENFGFWGESDPDDVFGVFVEF